MVDRNHTHFTLREASMDTTSDPTPDFDHSFKAFHDQDIPWEDGLDNNLLTLQQLKKW